MQRSGQHVPNTWTVINSKQPVTQQSYEQMTSEACRQTCRHVARKGHSLQNAFLPSIIIIIIKNFYSAIMPWLQRRWINLSDKYFLTRLQLMYTQNVTSDWSEGRNQKISVLSTPLAALCCMPTLKTMMPPLLIVIVSCVCLPIIIAPPLKYWLPSNQHSLAMCLITRLINSMHNSNCCTSTCYVRHQVVKWTRSTYVL